MRKTFPIVVEDLMKKNKKIFCLLGDIGIFSFRNVFKNLGFVIGLHTKEIDQTRINFITKTLLSIDDI